MRARCERWSPSQKSSPSSTGPLPLPAMTWQAVVFCQGNSPPHTYKHTLETYTMLLRFSFQLEKRHLSTVHLNAITRLYGEHGEGKVDFHAYVHTRIHTHTYIHTYIHTEILELLRKNPAGTIPVLIRRLRQKDGEWRRARMVNLPPPISHIHTYIHSSLLSTIGDEQALEGGGGKEPLQELRPSLLLLQTSGQEVPLDQTTGSHTYIHTYLHTVHICKFIQFRYARAYNRIRTYKHTYKNIHTTDIQVLM